MKKYDYSKFIPYVLLAIGAPAHADNWVFQLSPYLYMPNVTNTINTPYTSSMTLKRPFSDVYSALDQALFLQLIARKDHWITLADLNYAKLSQKGQIAIPHFGAQSASGNLKYISLSLLSGYRFTSSNYQQLSLDLLGGMRYWSFNSDLALSNYSLSLSKYWIEPVIASRFRYRLTPKISLVGYIDSSLSLDNQSWQWNTLLNYDLTDNITLSTGYKAQRISPELSKETVVSKSQGILVGFSSRF